MKRILLAAVVSLLIPPATSAQDFPTAFSYGGRSYIPGLSGTVNEQMRVYTYNHPRKHSYPGSWRGYWNGVGYRPSFRFHEESGWIEQRYAAGAFWSLPGYVPPHMGERIR